LISNILALNFGCDMFNMTKVNMAKMIANWKTGTIAPKARHSGGQATVEYAIVAGVLVAVAGITGLLLATFGDYGERILEMIASDYP
jgi:hypothetical protein